MGRNYDKGILLIVFAKLGDFQIGVLLLPLVRVAVAKSILPMLTHLIWGIMLAKGLDIGKKSVESRRK